MFRQVGFAAVLVALSAGVFGCGKGLSTADATIRCDQEKASKGQIVTPAVYQQCLSCYESCGDDCRPSSSTPATYTCADDSGTTSSSTGSTGAGGSK